jgi:cytochrome c oxidase accessory protein FixG
MTPAASARREPLPPAAHRHHPLRKRIHLACFLAFLALPLLDLLRFDIPRQRVYIAGFELWISEFSIIFFSLMFLMFLVAASAIIYGRIYCSYACPQMIFSEWSQAVQAWAAKGCQRWLPSWPPERRRRAGHVLWLAVLGVASVVLAFAFTSYFVAPRDLLERLARLDVSTAGGITGASVTLFTFLDFTLVRQKFCTTVCPYGYIQGILQDKHTLLVAYDDPDAACIDCRKCVRVCEMGIDIRKGPFQIECVHCGDCVDACEDVLRRVGHEGLIQYRWGGNRPDGARREPLPWRLGLRDGKRVVLLLLLAAYLCAMGVALAMRRPVLVTIEANRDVLYRQLPDGRVVNRVRFRFANRSSKATVLRVWTEGLPGAELDLAGAPLPLAAGETVERTEDLRVRPWPGAQEMNPFHILVQPASERSPDQAEMNFMMPAKGN